MRERLVGAFGILARDPLAAAHLLDPREQLLARNRVEREQEVLGRDELVLERAHLLESAVEHARKAAPAAGCPEPPWAVGFAASRSFVSR